jgi:hypothetical protein
MAGRTFGTIELSVTTARLLKEPFPSVKLLRRKKGVRIGACDAGV